MGRSEDILKGEIPMRRIPLLFVLVSLVLTAALFAADAAKEKAATEAAKKWLGLVDKGQYAESWKASSEIFRAAITSGKWDQALQGVRKPLGKVVSRKVQSATYSTTVPGAPDGEYMMIQFETVFENKSEAVETVTPMLEKDGAWKVSGYYIK